LLITIEALVSALVAALIPIPRPLIDCRCLCQNTTTILLPSSVLIVGLVSIGRLTPRILCLRLSRSILSSLFRTPRRFVILLLDLTLLLLLLDLTLLLELTLLLLLSLLLLLNLTLLLLSLLLLSLLLLRLLLSSLSLLHLTLHHGTSIILLRLSLRFASRFRDLARLAIIALLLFLLIFCAVILVSAALLCLSIYGGTYCDKRRQC
jgi:hypothetical protein